MEFGKQYILENNLVALEALLHEKYLDADPQKTVSTQYTENWEHSWEEINDVELEKVETVEKLCDYAVDNNRVECIKLLLRVFDWLFIENPISRILQKGLHNDFDDFLKETLTPTTFKYPAMLVKQLMMVKTFGECVIPKINGLETLFRYIPQQQQEHYAITAILRINTPFLPHLERLDSILSLYVADHSIFERQVLKLVSIGFKNNATLISDFVKLTPQYKWVDNDGNGFYHYASKNIFVLRQLMKQN